MSLRRDVIVVALAACGVGFAASAAEDLIAAAQRNDTTVALAAIEDGIDVNLKSPDGTTALHWAVYNGNLALVERLIAGGADVTSANEFGSTPLAEAATVGDVGIIAALLSAADRALYAAKADKANARRRGVVQIREWSNAG